MQKLVNVAEKYGEEMEIKFNPSKTNYISINRRISIKTKKHTNDLKQITMYNEPIIEIESMRYLGYYINNRLINSTHINNRKKKTFLAAFFVYFS